MISSRSPVAEPAYPVPFLLTSNAGPHRYLLHNTGGERVVVSLSLLGAGVMPASAPSSLDPGETLEFVISARDLARSTVLVVGWSRPDGAHYLWRVGF